MTPPRFIRIPGHCEGADLGGEPVNWLIYDTETGEQRLEWNPAYVPPPPPSLRELAEDAVADLRARLAEAEAHLAELASTSGSAAARKGSQPSLSEEKPA